MCPSNPYIARTSTVQRPRQVRNSKETREERRIAVHNGARGADPGPEHRPSTPAFENTAKEERLTELVGLLLEVDPLLCGGDVEEVADDELAAGAGGEVTRARVQHGERGRGDDTP